MAKRIVPTTTSGKKRNIFAIKGAIKMTMAPATNMAPNTPGKPKSGLAPMAIIAPIPVNETPIMIGSFTPNQRTPTVCTMVISPETNRSALIRKAISLLDKFSAPPMISGTAIAAAYITSTC
ncbi:hypothetical protein D9M71_595170 [compost metagenome]